MQDGCGNYLDSWALQAFLFTRGQPAKERVKNLRLNLIRKMLIFVLGYKNKIPFQKYYNFLY